VRLSAGLSTITASFAAGMRRLDDPAQWFVAIMARQKKRPRKRADDTARPGGAGEIAPEGQPTDPLSPDLAAAPTQPDDLPLPTTHVEPLASGGSEGEGEAIGAASVENAEMRSRLAFFGRSGQLAVMAEFLYRRINVAIPEVDVGDDIFVVKGSDETVTRVQVKSATAKEQKKGYTAEFNVPWAQLSVSRDEPALVYAFAVRHGNRWSDFVVIRRSALLAHHREGAGSLRMDPRSGRDYVQFRIVFTRSTARCGEVNLQRYRGTWDPWPPPRLEDEYPSASALNDAP
jgi:hypothetical protein